MIRAIRNYLLSAGSSNGVSGAVYFALWLVGFSGTVVSFVQLYRLQQGATTYKIGESVVWILAITMILQQSAVYKDLHAIEHSSGGDGGDDYAGWINLRLERLIRASIIISLLFGVGKVADAFHPLVRYIQRPVVKHWMENLLRAPETKNFSHSLFVKGSIFAFGFLAIWNVFAFFCRRRKWRQTTSPADRAHEVVILCRVGIFGLLCAGSTIFWIFLYTESELLPDYSVLIFAFYSMFVSVFVALRFDAVRQRCEKWLSEVIR